MFDKLQEHFLFRNYTQSQIYTGSPLDEDLASVVESYFSKNGLRETGHERGEDTDIYQALVSFPDPQDRNVVEILG